MSKSTEHITGVFVRIKRDDGIWTADIACLTDEELDIFLHDKTPQWNKELAKLLASWIRDNVITDPTEHQS